MSPHILFFWFVLLGQLVADVLLALVEESSMSRAQLPCQSAPSKS